MFERATKSKAKLRAAIYGPSGSGKTYSALAIATGMGGNIAVIDTERGSARKYSDRFQFDVCELQDRTIDGYLKAMDDAAIAGYDVLVVDSLSHAWQELLIEVDKLAATKFRGNTWSAWSEGTPRQRKLIDGLLDFPGHVIFTMRVDTEWTQEQDPKSGKTRPIKVGLKPQQGKSIEYEADILIEISPDHIATIAKDRTSKFQDRIIVKPGEDFGKELIAWLSEGATTKPQPRPSLDKLNELISKNGINDVQISAWQQHFKVSNLTALTDKQLDALIAKVEKSYPVNA